MAGRRVSGALRAAMSRAARVLRRDDSPPVQRAIRRLPRRSVVRRAVEEHEAGGSSCVPTLVDVLLAPDAGRPQEREAAAAVIPLLDLEVRERNALSELLTHVVSGQLDASAQAGLRAVRGPAIVAGAMGAAAGVAYIAARRYLLWSSPADFALTLLVVFPLVAAAFAPILGACWWPCWHVLSQAASARARAAAATALESIPTLGAAAPLARAAVSDSRAVRRSAVDALLQTLPLIEDHHYGHLPRQFALDLCSLLGRGSTASDLAIIEAMRRACGGVVHDTLQQQARSSATTQVRDAAARALPVIERRRDAERAAANLVRPAVPPDQGADLLVRPAPAGTAQDSESLGRAADAPNSRTA